MGDIYVNLKDLQCLRKLIYSPRLIWKCFTYSFQHLKLCLVKLSHVYLRVINSILVWLYLARSILNLIPSSYVLLLCSNLLQIDSLQEGTWCWAHKTKGGHRCHMSGKDDSCKTHQGTSPPHDYRSSKGLVRD